MAARTSVEHQIARRHAHDLAIWQNAVIINEVFSVVEPVSTRHSKNGLFPLPLPLPLSNPMSSFKPALIAAALRRTRPRLFY